MALTTITADEQYAPVVAVEYGEQGIPRWLSLSIQDSLANGSIVTLERSIHGANSWQIRQVFGKTDLKSKTFSGHTITAGVEKEILVQPQWDYRIGVPAYGFLAGDPPQVGLVLNTPLTSYVPDGYSLVWQDEFSSLPAFDQSGQSRWSTWFSKWGVRHLAGNADEGIKVSDELNLVGGETAGDVLRADGRWGNRARYLHEVSDRTLKLRCYPLTEAERPKFWGFPYVASMITAGEMPGQRYGYWEMRIRINTIGKGHHLALWLLSDDWVWPPEVDLLEVIGNNPSKYFADINPGDDKFTDFMHEYQKPASRDNGFYVFGFEWTPTVMRWTVDGNVVRESPNLVTNNKALYPLITWEIGSNWPGDPDASTPWPAEVEIDYVRVYAKTSN